MNIYEQHQSEELAALIARQGGLKAGDTITLKIGAHTVIYQWRVDARDPLGYWSRQA